MGSWWSVYQGEPNHLGNLKITSFCYPNLKITSFGYLRNKKQDTVTVTNWAYCVSSGTTKYTVKKTFILE